MTPFMRFASIGIRAFTLSAALSLGLLLPCVAPGEFLPIPLLAASFNYDIIVERTAPPPLQPARIARIPTRSGHTQYRQLRFIMLSPERAGESHVADDITRTMCKSSGPGRNSQKKPLPTH